MVENWTFGTAQKQPTQLVASGGPANVNATWTWGYGTDSTDNGNVMSATINGNGVSNASQSFGYDKINRLTGSSETGTWAWTRNHDYDAWANGWVTANIGLPPLTPFTPVASSNFDVNNRLNSTTWGYDSAGNQTSTGAGSFVNAYDGENRQITSAIGGVTTTYTYDGDGRRVQKLRSGVTTVFVYDAMGVLAAEYDSPAAQPSTCGTCYLTADTLGSTRMITDETATPRECHDYLPFGEEINRSSAGGCYATTTSNTLKFTGKERDQETGNDYFGARYLSAAQMRWTIPDWSAREEAMPYADVRSPQTLNLYQYLRNNPLGGVDPDGHSVWEPGRIGCAPNQPSCKPNPAMQLGAGNSYQTADEAGRAAAENARQLTATSVKRGDPAEYGGRLYRRANGTYSYTKPKRGEFDHIERADPKSIPKNTQDAGAYHSHPAGIAHTEPEVVSSADRTNSYMDSAQAKQAGNPYPIKPEYIGTPTGIIRFTPDLQSSLNTGTPGDVDRWEPSSGTWKPIPEQSSH
jgi:RHS repeat-associated protein